MLQTDIIITHDSNKDSADTKIHYAVLQSELTGELSKELEDIEKLKYSDDVDRLTKAIESMELDVEERKIDHETRMDSAKKQYCYVTETLKKITCKLIATDEYRYDRIYYSASVLNYVSRFNAISLHCSDKNVKEFYKSLKELARERSELLQLIQHREKEHKKLEEELR